jgi:DNA (cytosine-5)-methyltransferase 1
MSRLVLSLFPGVGLLDRAFEAEGFTVVRGPDVLWGGDVRVFHAPSDVFAGDMGGPPCQRFSGLANICRARYGEESLAPDLIPEFCRVVAEAQPVWFVMENVVGAPLPVVSGFIGSDVVLNNRECGGRQNRVRRFTFGTRDGRALDVQRMPEPDEWEAAVTSTAGGRRARMVTDAAGKPIGKQAKKGGLLKVRTVREMAVLQGLPEDFLKDSPFTDKGKREVIANGVPLPLGRAVARAVVAALGRES